MKHSILLFITVCCMLTANDIQAQPLSDSLLLRIHNIDQFQPELRRILRQQVKRKFSPKLKVTSAELLVGSSVRTSGIDIYDSITYRYSGSRGSNLTNQDINSYYGDFAPISQIDPQIRFNIPYLSYDTMIALQFNGPILNYRSVYGRSYDASNNIILQTMKTHDGNGNLTMHRYLNLSYDGANNLTAGAAYSDTSKTLSGLFTLTDSLKATYDAANNRLFDTIIYTSGNLIYNTIYTYNTSSQLTMSLSQIWDVSLSTWQNKNKSTYTYDALGRIKTSKLESWISNTWELILTDSFGYIGTTNMYAFHEALFYPSNMPPNGGRNIYTLTGFNAPDSIYAYYSTDLANWTLATVRKLNYNANQHLTSILTYSFDATNGTWYPTPYREDRFYYTFLQDVADIRKDDVSFASIYPNPASNMLTVKLSKPATAVVNIYDLAGRLLQRQTITLNHSEINVGNIVSGSYVAEIIQDGKKQHIKFEKQ